MEAKYGHKFMNCSHLSYDCCWIVSISTVSTLSGSEGLLIKIVLSIGLSVSLDLFLTISLSKHLQITYTCSFYLINSTLSNTTNITNMNTIKQYHHK